VLKQRKEVEEDRKQRKREVNDRFQKTLTNIREGRIANINKLFL